MPEFSQMLCRNDLLWIFSSLGRAFDAGENFNSIKPNKKLFVLQKTPGYQCQSFPTSLPGVNYNLLYIVNSKITVARLSIEL